MKKCHLNCEAFSSIDVFKGFCTLNKLIVMADEEGCENFEQVKKCRFCSHYTPTEEYLGLCMGNSIAYPDLLAKTCVDFEWKKEKDGQ